MRVKIDWASLIVGKTFTVFALFCFVFEGNFQVQAPGRGLYSEGRFNGGFFALQVRGAYIWRGLYMEGLIFGILWYTFFSKTTDFFSSPPKCREKESNSFTDRTVNNIYI